ncbi:hypothetical protein LZ31DRAFT_553055 [Colletotrichum somersetense]|nr:hypothetical protein LZ31DRAFT_553055 [Colletotrichum somersetense]
MREHWSSDTICVATGGHEVRSDRLPTLRPSSYTPATPRPKRISLPIFGRPSTSFCANASHTQDLLAFFSFVGTVCLAAHPDVRSLPRH